MANEDRRKYLVEINADAAEETTNLIATLPGVVSLTELTYRPSPIKPVQRTLGALIGELVAYERFLKKDTVKQASMSIGIGTEVFVDITKGKHPDIGYNRMARIAEYLGLEQAQITDLVENISAQREQIETQMGYKLMLDQRHDGAGGKHASDRDFTRSFRLNPQLPPLGGNTDITYRSPYGIFFMRGINLRNMIEGAISTTPTIKTATGYPVVKASIDIPNYILAPYEEYTKAKSQ